MCGVPHETRVPCFCRACAIFHQKGTQTKMNRKTNQRNFLPLVAAFVVIAAVAVTVMPKNTEEEDAPVLEPQSLESTFSVSNDIVIQAENIGIEASYFNYDADGITVQFFAVRASDDTIRMALNTCQVCNGSPYAYFEQDGDTFICQNCGNRFASTEIGITSGGCRPVPITEDIYTEQDGVITIPASFLDESATLFKNWKNF